MKIKEIYEIVKWACKTLYETYFPERNKIELKYEDELIFMTPEESSKLKDELGLNYEPEQEEVFMTLEESRDRKNKITEELNQVKNLINIVDKGITLPFDIMGVEKSKSRKDVINQTIKDLNNLSERGLTEEHKEDIKNIIKVLKDLRESFYKCEEEEDLGKFDELIEEKEQSLSTCIKDYNTLKITIPAKEPIITDDLKNIIKGFSNINIDAFTSIDKEKMEESVEVLKKTIESLRNQGIIFAGEEDLDKLKKNNSEE